MKSLTTVQDNTKALAGIVKNVTSNSYHFSRICLIGKSDLQDRLADLLEPG
jgi:hypothetical protein